MSEHTPGPWKLDMVAGGYNVGIVLPMIVDERPATWHRLGRIGGALSSPHVAHQDRANALLVAAAPDLLGVGQKLLAAIREYRMTQADIDEFQATVDKAKG